VKGNGTAQQQYWGKEKCFLKMAREFFKKQEEEQHSGITTEISHSGFASHLNRT
jgi:hypothetical protein